MKIRLPGLRWRGSRVESLAAAVLLVLAAAASHPGLMAQTPAPVIEKLNPASGPVGANVKIKGSNFGTSSASGSVTFNGTVASPTSMVGNVGSQSTEGQEGKKYPRRGTKDHEERLEK